MTNLKRRMSSTQGLIPGTNHDQVPMHRNVANSDYPIFHVPYAQSRTDAEIFRTEVSCHARNEGIPCAEISDTGELWRLSGTGIVHSDLTAPYTKEGQMGCTDHVVHWKPIQKSAC